MKLPEADYAYDIIRDPKFSTVHREAFIHPKAEVDHYEKVSIGARTKVWQFASVIRGAKIGQDCSIASCAIVDGSRLGDNVIVSHSAFIDPGILIGNGVFIGPHVNLCNDFWPRVSKDGWFNMDDLVNGTVTVTRIEDGASIGAGATVMPGIVVGNYAMVAAGAVVTRWVPDGHLFKRDGSIEHIRKEPNRKRQVYDL